MTRPTVAYAAVPRAAAVCRREYAESAHNRTQLSEAKQFNGSQAKAKHVAHAAELLLA